MSNRLVHVARDGKIIGQYPPEQLASLIDTGHFLDSDLCFSESHPEWTPLPDFLKKTQAPKYARVAQGESRPPSRGSSRRGRHRSNSKAGVFLGGWIAFLLALSALVGAVFWIAGLNAEIAKKSAQLGEMEKTIALKEKENQRLLFVSRELAEPGTVRGSAIMRNEAGKRVAMPGIQIFLFPRKIIEEYLEARRAEVPKIPEGAQVDLNEFFTRDLPIPLANTTTDASGRFEFSIPAPGEYVLFTRMNVLSQNAQSQKIWLVGFNSEDPLNTLVEINDANFVQQFVPSLMIVQGR